MTGMLNTLSVDEKPVFLQDITLFLKILHISFGYMKGGE